MTGHPLATIAALHVLLAQNPELASLPIDWTIRQNGELQASPPYHAEGSNAAVRALAAALGCETDEYEITSRETGKTSTVVRIAFSAALAGGPVTAYGYEELVPLRVHPAAADEQGPVAE